MKRGSFFLHFLYLLLATFLTWLWTNSPTLSYYNLQLIAFLLILWLIKVYFTKKEKGVVNLAIDASVFTLVVLLLVFSTGGASSPLFFLLFFLLFGLAFTFEPPLVITFTFILLAFLAPGVKDINDAASLVSLFLVTPLALFFGQLKIRLLAEEKRAALFQKKWVKDENHLENQESNTLLWLSLKLKPGLIEIIDKTSQLLADLSHLTPSQASSLKRIKRVAKELLKGGEKLLSLVDKETDRDE